MTVRLLGAIEITAADGRILTVQAPKRRAVLAMLASQLNRVVSVDSLLDGIWEGAPPRHARTAIQVHISALRKILGTDLTLETRAPGYVLRGEPSAVDACLFAELARRAGTADDATAAGLLREALRLWRGPALADLPETPLRTRLAEDLTQLRISVVESLAERLLRLGRGAEVLDELAVAVVAHPLREPLIRLQMLALAQNHRSAEAIEVYAAASRKLAEALGVDPGPQLQEVHQRLLGSPTGDRGHHGADGGGGGDGRSVSAPQGNSSATRAARNSAAPGTLSTTHGIAIRRPTQLPREVPGFVGRQGELDWLEALLHQPFPSNWTNDVEGAAAISSGAEPDEPMAPAVVVGPAGVGKTSLVLRWSHHAADYFPDGQLYVNLRGFDEVEPLSATSALNGILRALGVQERMIPVHPDQQAALYRTLVAHRRLLLVLDNARDADQVRALLPGQSPTIVLVTSRNRMEGLAVTLGARILTLFPMSSSESFELLAVVAGRSRLLSDQRSAYRLVELCESLPLALKIVAAQLATRPQRDLAAMVEELTDEQERLAALATDDADISVEAALAATYHALPEPFARLFRLLSLHPGNDIDAYTAAALMGGTRVEAKRALAYLANVHLLNEHQIHRYIAHDLVRLYQRSLTRLQVPTAERTAAVDRLLDYYLAVSAIVRQALRFPVNPEYFPPADRMPVSVPQFATVNAGLDWFAAEEPAMRALIQQAGQLHRNELAWQMMCNLVMVYYRRGMAADWVAANRAGLTAARTCGDAFGEYSMLQGLGSALAENGDNTESVELFDAAISIAASLPPDSERMDWTFAIAIAALHTRATRGSSGWESRFITLAEQTAQGQPQERVLLGNYLTTKLTDNGDLAGATKINDEMMRLVNEHDLTFLTDEVWYVKARLLVRQGDLEQAAAVFRTAEDLADANGNRRVLAMALDQHSEVMHELGNPEDARIARKQAIEIYERLGMPEAAELRARLDSDS